jgi:hypothetical protein
LRLGRKDLLAARSKAMRVLAPGAFGAQLTLFETEDGWKYVLSATNLPEATRSWRRQPAYIEATHRVHFHVEDGISTGKDTGIGQAPGTRLDTRGSYPVRT